MELEQDVGGWSRKQESRSRKKKAGVGAPPQAVLGLGGPGGTKAGRDLTGDWTGLVNHLHDLLSEVGAWTDPQGVQVGGGSMVPTSTWTEGKDGFQELMKEQEVKKLKLPGDRIFQMSENKK